MDSWVIDSYGLRAAHSHSVLDRLRDTHRLYVSPATWRPGNATGADGKFSLTRQPAPSRQLSLVDNDVCRPNGSIDLDTRLRELHDQGVLNLAGEHECEPQIVADVEKSWNAAGLVWRPTNETFSAVITAGRLDINLITEDTDVRKLAHHWQLDVMTVADFASALAA
jgi:hypothetical protein